jgi:hypothetical protein
MQKWIWKEKVDEKDRDTWKIAVGKALNCMTFKVVPRQI